jgi:D-threonate/D-erythronate kinase
VAGQIIVLADDLSGAAELAGVACTLGHAAEVQRQYEPASKAEVIAIDSDSRNLTGPLAAQRVQKLAQQISASQPAWIFKKVDSVLRGHPRAEIEALLAATQHSRAILIPANPSRGRIIDGGRYLIDGIPLDQTPLARDSDYPRRSASVLTLLGEGRLPIHHLKPDGPSLRAGIAVPDVRDMHDLQRRAAEVDANTLAAGAADFFTAILERRLGVRPRPDATIGPLASTPALLVCGSRVSWPQRERECRTMGASIATLADDEQAIARFRGGRVMLLGIGGAVAPGAQGSALLRELADRVAYVLEQMSVATLLVEGGATAEAVAERMGWSLFSACAPGPAGVGILQPITDTPAPRVLMKPGSYPWPNEIWVQLRQAR